MNEKEKSLKLAELMGWPIPSKSGWPTVSWYAQDRYYAEGKKQYANLQPYRNDEVGLAQFAAILLTLGDPTEGWESIPTHFWTQSNILDEILRLAEDYNASF